MAIIFDLQLMRTTNGNEIFFRFCILRGCKFVISPGNTHKEKIESKVPYQARVRDEKQNVPIPRSIPVSWPKLSQINTKVSVHLLEQCSGTEITNKFE